MLQHVKKCDKVWQKCDISLQKCDKYVTLADSATRGGGGSVKYWHQQVFSTLTHHGTTPFLGHWRVTFLHSKTALAGTLVSWWDRSLWMLLESSISKIKYVLPVLKEMSILWFFFSSLVGLSVTTSLLTTWQLNMLVKSWSLVIEGLMQRKFVDGM